MFRDATLLREEAGDERLEELPPRSNCVQRPHCPGPRVSPRPSPREGTAPRPLRAPCFVPPGAPALECQELGGTLDLGPGVLI